MSDEQRGGRGGRGRGGGRDGGRDGGRGQRGGRDGGRDGGRGREDREGRRDGDADHTAGAAKPKRHARGGRGPVTNLHITSQQQEKMRNLLHTLRPEVRGHWLTAAVL